MKLNFPGIVLFACVFLSVGCRELPLEKAHGVLSVEGTRAGGALPVQLDFAEVFRGDAA